MMSRPNKMLCVAVVALAILASLGPANAVYVINATESGTTVVFNGSGSLDLSALTFNSFWSANPVASTSNSTAFTPRFGIGGPPTMVWYGYGELTSVPTFFATPGRRSFGTGSGDWVATAFYPVDGVDIVGVSRDYQSGDFLSSQLVVPGSFASNGYIPGTYEWTWGTPGQDFDKIVLNIGIIPTPHTATMLGVAAISLFARRRRGAKSKL